MPLIRPYWNHHPQWVWYHEPLGLQLPIQQIRTRVPRPSNWRIPASTSKVLSGVGAPGPPAPPSSNGSWTSSALMAIEYTSWSQRIGIYCKLSGIKKVICLRNSELRVSRVDGCMIRTYKRFNVTGWRDAMGRPKKISGDPVIKNRVWQLLTMISTALVHLTTEGPLSTKRHLEGSKEG